MAQLRARGQAQRLATQLALLEAREQKMVRFLGLTGLADAAWVQAHARLPLPSRQRQGIGIRRRGPQSRRMRRLAPSSFMT